MFIVISMQNALSTQIPSFFVVFLSENPHDAIQVAKDAISNEDDNAFIGKVFVCDIEKEKQYRIWDFEKDKNLVFTTWKTDGDKKYHEWYGDDYQVLKRRKIDTNGTDNKAASGMFRVVVMIDSDEMQQVGDDMEDRNKAYYFGSIASQGGYPFQIFDDQGVKHVDENGRLIPIDELVQTC